MHLSCLSVGWLDFTKPEDGVKVVEYMGEGLCVLKEVMAKGMDFRDQESRGSRVNGWRRENESYELYFKVWRKGKQGRGLAAVRAARLKF